MGARTPGAGPPSPDRRRVLLALGFGALNLAALSQLSSAGHVGRLATGNGRGNDGDGSNGGGNGDPTVQAAGSTQATPALTGAEPEPEAGHVFGTVITGGRVIDPETGFDDVANVGLDGGTITAVTRDSITGTNSIDATGMVVAPGFIDLLSYEPNNYGEWYKIADGVTTNLGMHGLDFEVSQFFDRWNGEGCPVNFGGAYDSPFRRHTLCDLDPGDAASPAQLDQLADDCREQLAGGWIGVDMEPEYTPGVEYEELKRFAQVAAEAGVGVYVHGRYSDDQPPGTNADTLNEIISLARDTGCSAHVEHIISTGGTFTMAASLATVEAAIAEGLDISACMYPYDYWATYLGSARFNSGWQDRFHISYDDLVVAGTGERLTAQTFPARQRDNLLVAAYAIPEDDVVTCIKSPRVMIGSDAILEESNNNHPRAAGCFSRVLGRYVRETQTIGLIDGLAKMTILPARRLQGAAPAMARKGRLQRGADADVVVFDPNTVADRSTVENPAQQSVGMQWVIVGGVAVMSPDGIDHDQKPGKAITNTA